MSVRHAARRVVVSLAATAAAGAFAAMAFSAPAGAVEPGNGQSIPGSAQAVAPFTAGTPFSSGQNINVVVPANTAFAGTSSALNVVECAAPNGVIPTDVTQCDGDTIQGNTIIPNADGSFSYNAYTVYALPDLHFEGSSGPVCGDTLATECILYIGEAQNDFTQPHVWSQPFLISSNGGSDAGASPGDGTPEVPIAIILPIAALGMLGGTLAIRRRRQSARA
jgi:hypothetical protein